MGEEAATNQFKFASELERIFLSAEFARSPVMRRLLRFLVNETLAGRGDQLKAYSVAVDGLGRDPDFDAQTDSYPRVQVGRLRRMLDAYYSRSGTMNGERLVIPNGAYRVFLQPVYRKQERPSAPASLESYALGGMGSMRTRPQEEAVFPMLVTRNEGGRRPRRKHAVIATAIVLAGTLAALLLLPRGWSISSAPAATLIGPAPTLLLQPVETSSNSPPALAPSVDQVLGDALHRSWVVDVRSPTGGGAKTTYRLQGVLAGPSGEDLYLTLWNNRTGGRVWTSHTAISEQGSSLSDQLQTSIANLIGSFGVIATDQRKSLGSVIQPGYPCLLKHAELRFSPGAAYPRAARKCLEAMLAVAPDSSTALAVAADANYRMARGEPHRADRLKNLAMAQAKRALLLDPYSPQAQMVSAAAAVVEGNCTSAKVQGLRAVELNPYEPEYQARFGMLLFQCSDPEHERYLTTARQLYPALPAFYSLPVIAAMLERGEKQEALRLALSQTPPASLDSPFYPLTMAVAYAGAGEKGRAEYYWRQVVKAAGGGAKAPGELLKAMMISPEMTEATGRLLLRTGVVKSLG